MSDDVAEPQIDPWTAAAVSAETAALQLVCCAILRQMALASPQPGRHFAVNFFAGVKRDLRRQPVLPVRREAVQASLDAFAVVMRRALPAGETAEPDRGQDPGEDP